MKMRRNPGLAISRNIYCLAVVLILIPSFAGSARGSCINYGHSCWGAHGKRSGGVGRPLENAAGDRRWLFSRLVNRQLMQQPLLRGRAEVRAELSDDLKHSAIMDKLSGNADLSKVEQGMVESESPDILSYSQLKDFTNDDNQAIKVALYKILKNFDENRK